MLSPPISTTERCISRAAVGARISVASPSKVMAWITRSVSVLR
nr:Uncharacterised protein [Klebsiella pneumoniae]